MYPIIGHLKNAMISTTTEKMTQFTKDVFNSAFSIFYGASQALFIKDGPGHMPCSHIPAELMKDLFLIDHCQFVDDLPITIKGETLMVIDHKRIASFAEKKQENNQAMRMYYDGHQEVFVAVQVKYKEGEEPNPMLSVPDILSIRGFHLNALKDDRTAMYVMGAVLDSDPDEFSEKNDLISYVH